MRCCERSTLQTTFIFRNLFELTKLQSMCLCVVRCFGDGIVNKRQQPTSFHKTTLLTLEKCMFIEINEYNGNVKFVDKLTHTSIPAAISVRCHHFATCQQATQQRR